MVITSTTDAKYIGLVIPRPVVGLVIALGDFLFEVQSTQILENGSLRAVSPNYQLTCEE